MNHRFGRPTIRQIILYTLLIAAALAVVVVYMAGGNKVFEDDTEEQSYVYQDTVTLPMHAVRTLNPATSTDEDTYYITPLLYGSLFRLDPSMSPVMDLAESYQFDPDTSSITVKIRDDAVWDDGAEVRGYDVVFAIEVYRLAGSGCNYKDMIDRIGYVQSEGKSVTIYFNEDDEMGLDLLTFPLLPSHRYEYYGEAMSDSGTFKPVGCGPYKVKSYDPNDRLILEPSETYYGTVPTNTLTFDTEGMKGDPYQRLQAGGVSLMIAKDPDRETYITKKDISVTNFPANTVEFIGFNCKTGAFSDRNVRRAVCCAIDCDTIIDMQYYGSGMKNDGMFFPGYMGIDSSELTYPFDIKKAQEALEEAGYKDTDENGNIVDSAGNVLSVRIPVNKADAEKAGSAEIVAESLEELGIVVSVVEMSSDEYYAALKAGEFDLYFGSYTFDKKMDMRALFGYESTNYAGYDNDGLVALLQELRAGSSIEEMQDLVKRIREITISDVPYYCILYRTYGAVGASTFDGEPTPLWCDYYYNAAAWRSKFPEKQKTGAEAEENSGEAEEGDSGDTDEE
ncbi:MAG: hypothetical protein K6B12_05430 [Clostridiales bacterium]|nr:hypothetical protein [Clostridiales bacterium]